MDATTCAGATALITQQHEIIGLLMGILTAMGAGGMLYAHTRLRNGKGTNGG